MFCFLVAKYPFVLFVISPADYPAVWSAHMLSSLLAFLLLGRPNRRKAGRKSLGSNPYYLWFKLDHKSSFMDNSAIIPFDSYVLYEGRFLK